MSDLALKLIRAAKEKHLTRLELGRCGLTELPEELFALEWLEELVVSNLYWDDKKKKWIESQNQGEPNRLSQIPGSISRLIKLRKLYIMGDIGNPWEISDLSPLATLADLLWLHVYFTQVSDLSPLEKLTNLQRLYVGDTQVSDLSPLEKLTNLQELYVDATQVSDLSPLGKLTNLQGLYVDDTQVSDLSPLEKLTNLQWLAVADTQVSDLWPLEKLTDLQTLAVSGTQVSDLKPLLPLIEKGIPVKWSKRWWEGSGIYVQDCPLSHPLPEIVQQNNEAILNYFRQIEEQGGTEPLYEARLLIVGEPGAGKTSLMKKLLDPTYRVPPPQGEESTVGINVHGGWPFPYAPQPDILFTANLWDFGGQEIQYMTHQFFLSPRSLYVLTADDRKQHTNFPYWFEVIHLLGKGEDGTQSPILVALNENNHKSVTNYDHRAYTERYTDTLIEKREVDLSLDDGRFEALQQKIQDMLCRLKHVGNPLPRLWRPIRNALKELAKQHNHISEREFMEVCSDHGLKQQKAQLLLSDYLHCLGVILHYRNDPQLRDFIILNPQWAVDAVYSVLSDDRVKKSAGRFHWNFLEEVWRDYSREERSRLLMLMTKTNFEICYEIADGQYIAPQLLDDVKPVYAWEGVSSLKFRFRYQFMPKAFLRA